MVRVISPFRTSHDQASSSPTFRFHCLTTEIGTVVLSEWRLEEFKLSLVFSANFVIHVDIRVAIQMFLKSVCIHVGIRIYNVGIHVVYMQQIEVVKRKQTRYSKGVVIAASRRIIKVHGEKAWLVESEITDDKFYKVTEDGNCECPDHRIRGQTCKHFWALVRRTVT
jgi:hypothetical protein